MEKENSSTSCRTGRLRSRRTPRQPTVVPSSWMRGPLFYGGKICLVDNESDMVGGGCTAWEEFLDMTRDEETEGASAILEVPSGGVLVTPAAGPDAKDPCPPRSTTPRFPLRWASCRRSMFF